MMEKCEEIADIQRLLSSGFDDWESLGNVYTKKSGDLTLFNYTARATYGDSWNYFEKVSRGLIINSVTGEIVGRPFDKFFNYGQDGYYPTSPIKSVTEKMDGSLGILYRENGGYRVATRGSFDSEQALWATERLNKRFNLQKLTGNLTLLFEIIYPDNRIVIDYGGMEALVLIGARNRFTGQYLSFSRVQILSGIFGFSLPKSYTFNSPDEIVRACETLDGNREGWVVEFENGERFKFKGQQYMDLHRLISGLSFKNVLRYIKDGEIEKLLSNTPDEFLGDVNKWIAQVDHEVTKVSGKANAAFEAAPKGSRKEFAQWVMKNHKNLSTYLFAMLDGKPIKSLIYKMEF